MSNNGPFGFDPDDLDRIAREASDGLKDIFGQVMKGMSQPGTENPLAAMFKDAGFGASGFGASGFSKPAQPEPETTGQTGDGVWAIYTVDGDGSARIDQLYATELDALRAHKDNTDTSRRVRFLPYGVSVGVLDDTDS